MKKKYALLALFVFVMAGAGCITTQDYNQQSQRLNMLQEEVRDLKKSLQAKEMETDRLLGQARGTMPELNLRVDRLQQEVQRLVDAIEIAEQRGGGAGTLTLKNQLDHMRARLDRLEAQLKLPPLDFKVIEDANQAEQELQDRIHIGDGSEPAAVAGEDQPAEGPMNPEQTAFNAAKESFTNKNYTDSLQLFQTFLRDYPKSEFAASAQFYVGESLYGQQKYEEAILAYQEVIKNYPKSSKLPTALLKQALSFMSIGDETSGKLLLQKVIREHPKSYAAGVAKKRLDAMK